MTTNEERERFEAWATAKYGPYGQARAGEGYFDTFVNACWAAWQGRARDSTPQPPTPAVAPEGAILSEGEIEAAIQYVLESDDTPEFGDKLIAALREALRRKSNKE